MPNIRIKDIPTTASATSSTDFIGIDGSANGTRKLNAYSPTFGGNLTVSGTGTFSGNLSATGEISCNGSGGALRADSRTGSGLNWYIYNPTGADLRLFNSTGGNVLILTNAGAATLTGNLTVSGGDTTVSAGKLKVYTGNVSSWHANIGSGANSGLYINGLATTQTLLGAGMAFESPNWMARGGTTASGYHLNAGAHAWYGDTGLTDGASFTPTSRMTLSTAGNLTLQTGNLTVSGGTITGGTSGLSLAAGGSVQNITITPSGGAKTVIRGSDGGSGTKLVEFAVEGGSVVASINGVGHLTVPVLLGGGSGISLRSNAVAQPILFEQTSSVEVGRFAATTGNFLIGTTTDGGQKLQVAGSGIFSTTEPVVTLASTAVGNIAYQLISGGGSGHALGAFKIYDSSTGYVVLNHDKPTSGGTRLSFDGAGNATFAGNASISKANPELAIRSASDAAGQIQYLTFGSPLYNRAQFRVTSAGTSDGSIALYTFNAASPILSQTWTKEGNVTLTGTLGVGTSASGTFGIYVTNSITNDGAAGVNSQPTVSASGGSAYAYYGSPLVSTNSMGAAYVMRGQIRTAASAITLSNAYGYFAAAPTLGATSAITYSYGAYIENQGKTGITHAYGINIEAQSGAATTNIGLRNLGATVLATPAAAVTLADNSTMTFELTSNTSLTIKVRGTDGTTRSVALTLA